MKNNKAIVIGLSVLVLAGLIAYLFVSYQSRTVVEIKRKGSGPADVTARLSNPCGDVPNNIKSASSSTFEAAISKALKGANPGPKLDADIKAALASTLDQMPASSQMANDLVVLEVTACRTCLANGLASDECIKLGTDVRQDYVDLKKKSSK